MNRITLLTGGGRSGKSAYALVLAEPFANKAFIATAMAFDHEMRDRILRHKMERSAGFITIEEPLDLAGAIARIPGDTEVAIIDCLAVWIGNCMHLDEAGVMARIDAFLDALANPACELLIVTNEVGMGIIPENEMARRYRDLLGTLNQRVAALADRVVLMVSGIPMEVKGATIGNG